MELLSYIAQAGKRKAKFEERARDLARQFNSVEEIEAEMADRAEALVRRLHSKTLNFVEFQRVAADDTITTALASVMLGDTLNSKLSDTTFASSLEALPYLWKFFRDIKSALSLGKIVQGDGTDFAESPTKYASRSIGVDDEIAQQIIDQTPTSLLGVAAATSAVALASWIGVSERLKRYISSPAWSWYNTGRAERKRRQGYREMRRIAPLDRKTCQACLGYHAQGWQPIGLLPMPGKRCNCYDRCRCRVEYR